MEVVYKGIYTLFYNVIIYINILEDLHKCKYGIDNLIDIFRYKVDLYYIIFLVIN